MRMLYIGSLYMHPTDPQTMLAAAGHEFGLAAWPHWQDLGDSPAGIYRTTNAGELWSQVYTPVDSVGEEFSSVEESSESPEHRVRGQRKRDLPKHHRGRDLGEGRWIAGSMGSAGRRRGLAHRHAVRSKRPQPGPSQQLPRRRLPERGWRCHVGQRQHRLHRRADVERRGRPDLGAPFVRPRAIRAVEVRRCRPHLVRNPLFSSRSRRYRVDDPCGRPDRSRPPADLGYRQPGDSRVDRRRNELGAVSDPELHREHRGL